MGGFDRSQFGQTSLKAIKAQEKAQEALRPTNRNSDRVAYHKLTEGENKFRIYPFHLDGGGNSFYEAKSSSFLDVTSQKYGDDNKPIEDEFEVKRKPVFNAKVHGVDSDGNALKMDLVDVYLDTLKKKLEEEYEGDKEGYQAKWNIATSGKKAFFKTCIKPSDKWVVYADKWNGEGWEFGILEFSKSIKFDLNDLSSQNEGEDDVVNVDPFSNPDTGICIVIEKDSVAGKKDPKNYYKVDFEETRVAKKGGGFTTESNPTPLSDQALTAFMDVPPLHKKLRGVYTETTFTNEIEGLDSFDKAQGFGVCDSDEYLEALTYLSENVQPDPEREERGEEDEVDSSAPEPKPAPAEKAIPTPTPAVEPEEPEEEEESPFVEDEPEAVTTTTTVETKTLTAAERVAAIRAKLGK